MHRIMCSGDAKCELLANCVGNGVYFFGQTSLDAVQTYLEARNLSSRKLQIIIL
jgi:hypothetical protein